ncbi:MAG: hypothetical protein GX777_01415 [Fastidiosipila sp.]|nr:hypothetical protein [Fastidiosipila sp.]
MRKMKAALTREDGVTLVELLAAIILLSIIVVSFMGFFTMAAQTNSRTNTVNEATFLAQQEIELVTHYSIEGKSMGQLTGQVEPEISAPFGKDGDVWIRTASSNGYDVETTISEYQNESETTLYKVLVIVKKGGESRAQMETYLSFKETSD